MFAYLGETAITGAACKKLHKTVQSDGGGETAEAKQAWWRRLSGGLKRSSTALTAISDLVTKRMLDEATLEDIHDALVKADLGIGTADRIADTLSRRPS